MSRHATFRFCLDPTVEQCGLLARHAGAARLAFNQCLRMVRTALAQRRTDPDARVPWSTFDLINAFNAWKKTEEAGRVLVVDIEGVAEVTVTGLRWRNEICQQVFEEAAADLGRGLKAWSDSRCGRQKGRRVGFPGFKKKTQTKMSFRIRNRCSAGRKPAIRVGDHNRPRSITLPGIGQIKIHDDTRRLRRMLSKGRAKILYVSVTRRASRWWVAVNVDAVDLHTDRRHPARERVGSDGTWVGIDRGLSAFLVASTADGTEVARITDAPKPLIAGMRKQRRLAKALSRKQKGSGKRRNAAVKLARHHHRVANVRRYFLHQVSNELVKTHDRLVIEDLNVAGMVRNRRLSRAISDAAWAEFARQLEYKQDWYGGELIIADRWFPSSRLCPGCDSLRNDLALGERTFTCSCGRRVDRDYNAAVNLARWAQSRADEIHHEPRTPKLRGRATNARGRDGADRHPSCADETSPIETGTDVHPPPAA